MARSHDLGYASKKNNELFKKLLRELFFFLIRYVNRVYIDFMLTTFCEKRKDIKIFTVLFEFIDMLEPETDDDFPEPLDLSPRDERPLSPLFQRSVSEDSAGSSASTTRKAKTRLVHTQHTQSCVYVCI